MELMSNWPRHGVWLGGLGLLVTGPLVILGAFVTIDLGCDRIHALGGLLCAMLSAGLCLAGLGRRWTRGAWLFVTVATAVTSFWLSILSIRIC